MLLDVSHDSNKQERRKRNSQQESYGRVHFHALSFQIYVRFEASDVGDPSAAQLRWAAIERYPLRKIPIIPGILEIHSNGRPHQISRANATAASAPPYRLPSLKRNCISRINSSRDNPSTTPTRGPCSAATASPRRSRIGASHCAILVQNLHPASKKNNPRACGPFPSGSSLTNEIIAVLFFPSFLFSVFSVLSLFAFSEPFDFQPLTAFFPSNVITFPRSFTTPFNAPVGIRIISSNNPVIAVKNSSMLSSRSRVYASPCGFAFTSRTHSASTLSVGSISRRLRSSETIRKISQTSLIDSKWSRRSPKTCTTRTIRHPCNSRKLVLTFDRATASVSEISSAGNGLGDKKSNACTCATVRLIPHRVPISPQCKINFCATGVNEFFVASLIFDLPRFASFAPLSSYLLFLSLQNILFFPALVKPYFPV